MATTWLNTRDVEESALQLGEEIGSGGQGQVFRIQGKSAGIVYKRYKITGADSGALKLLVDMPSSLSPSDRERLLRLSAWPLARVVRGGQLCGFLMQEVPSRFCARNSMGSSKARELQYLIYERKPAWGDLTAGDVSAKTRVGVAREFASLVNLLHSKALVIGDVSMKNVLWAPGDPPSIFLIDCDGIRQLGSPPVLPQADTPDWNDPQQPASGPDLDSDRYKLALLIGRVLCKAPYLHPGEELQLVPDLPGDVGLRVQGLWARASGPRTDRPEASDWIAALNGAAEVPARPSAEISPSHADRAAPWKATLLDGRYRLEQRLGSGSFGSVWKAYDTRLERTVAVKELASWPDSEENRAVRRERLRREALALAQVEHPAVVSVYDLIYQGEDPWLVMSYVHGRSLHSIISDSAPLDERRVARIGFAVLLGLMACHERHVYHRDVKPANILLSDDGQVHLVDFGIAHIVGSAPLTTESKVIGTPEFLAPELLTSSQSPGPETDLWALGATLYYALEGRSPFRAETLHATLAALLSKNPPKPRTGDEIATLVLAMLRKNPSERPDAAAVAAVLQRAAGEGRATRSHRPDRQETRDGAAHQPRDAGRPWLRLDDSRQTRSALTPLSDMTVPEAAKIVNDWPAPRAAAGLLTLGEAKAARIINACEDSTAGKLLSTIAADNPVQGGKILEMLATARAGRLIDNMSSPASVSVLSLLSPTGAARLLAHVDDVTVVSILTAMKAQSAADLVTAMETGRAARLLSQAPPTSVANILQSASSDRRRALMDSLPQELRSLIARHL